MRTLLRTICVAIVALALTTPALAETLPGPAVHPIKQVWRDANGIAEDAEAIRIRGQYCKPPNQPMKAETQAAIDALRQQLQALRTQHNQLKKDYDDAGDTQLETSIRTAFPKLDGMEHDHPYYWSASNAILTKAQRAIDEKQKALDRAPERDCSRTPPKTEEIIGSQPPVQPPPPPPPPLPPPPVDPLKGLNRPTFTAVNVPLLKDRYCSQAEKDADLAKFPPEVAKLNSQIAEMDAYIAAVKARRGELQAKGVEQHWLDSMDYEVRQAEIIKEDRRTTIKALETTRSLVASTPIVDCSKVGSLPGTALGVGLAYGDLTIPKKPYLSLEVGSDLFLGVVDYETEDELLVITGRVEYEFKSDSLPNVRLLGDPRDQRWMTSAELFGYDYSIFAEGRDITTTTEGVGIPGTGDPMSSFPEGVFFANPDFNDVTGLRYAHDSDFRGGKLGFGQKSYYDSHACYVGVGVGYNRLRTVDVLTGTVDGFLTDFRYETDIATRGTNLFIQGGVEIPLDNFWDQQLRYAGEFSGFRLSAGVEGRANFLDAEGLDRLDLSGFVNDSQAVRVGKDDTTFNYKLSAGLNYAPTGIKGLDVSLGVEYGESDTHPVPHRSGQTGETTRIEFEQEEVFVGTLGTRFRF
jgi:opacity protein-like surface antigen